MYIIQKKNATTINDYHSSAGPLHGVHRGIRAKIMRDYYRKAPQQLVKSAVGQRRIQIVPDPSSKTTTTQTTVISTSNFNNKNYISREDDATSQEEESSPQSGQQATGPNAGAGQTPKKHEPESTKVFVKTFLHALKCR